MIRQAPRPHTGAWATPEGSQAPSIYRWAQGRGDGNAPRRALQDSVAQELLRAPGGVPTGPGAGLSADVADCDDCLAGPAALEVLLGKEQTAAEARRCLGGHCSGGEESREGLAELREAEVGVADFNAALGLAGQTPPRVSNLAVKGLFFLDSELSVQPKRQKTVSAASAVVTIVKSSK